MAKSCSHPWKTRLVDLHTKMSAVIIAQKAVVTTPFHRVRSWKPAYHECSPKTREPHRPLPGRRRPLRGPPAKG
eukprot:25701-Lingulodinium_polyedra.AAC.1